MYLGAGNCRGPAKLLELKIRRKLSADAPRRVVVEAAFLKAEI